MCVFVCQLVSNVDVVEQNGDKDTVKVFGELLQQQYW